MSHGSSPPGPDSAAEAAEYAAEPLPIGLAESCEVRGADRGPRSAAAVRFPCARCDDGAVERDTLYSRAAVSERSVRVVVGPVAGIASICGGWKPVSASGAATAISFGEGISNSRNTLPPHGEGGARAVSVDNDATNGAACSANRRVK